MDELQIKSRADWKAEKPQRTLFTLGEVHFVTIHRTATPDADPVNTVKRLQGIQHFHQAERGWPDIGYHFLIDRYGKVWQGLGLTFKGCHTREHNRGNIGVALFGTEKFTPEQKRGLEALLRHLAVTQKRLTVPALPLPHASIWLRCHGDWPENQTSCPGPVIRAWVEELTLLFEKGR